MFDRFRKYTLLYVEDHESTRENYTLFFNSLFHTVYTASDGREALELYTRYRPDIAILDIMMPLIDGLELSKIIRKDDDRVPLIILTAYLDTDKLLLATELDLTKYLTKPVDYKKLLESLDLAADRLERDEKRDAKMILYDGCVWDIKYEKLFQESQEIVLTKNEKRLCSYLISRIGQTCSVEDILDDFWHAEDPLDMSENALRGLLKRLKKKVSCLCVENIYGIGYRINGQKEGE